MTSSAELGREIHVEWIVGKVVHDVDGARAGRIEEMIVERRGTDYVITEYHLGGGAMLERIMNFAGELKLLGFLQRLTSKPRKATWDQLDLRDPRRPRLTVRYRDLPAFDP